jgi:DNA-binding NarL/FixJ family response regulator
MPDALRLVIAEDHYLVREGTRKLLEDSGEVEVIAAVGTATELLDAVRRLSPNAALTDIRMPPSHSFEGIEAAHRIRADHPDVGVVVLSQHSDPEYAVELLKEGAAGLAYLLKDRLGEVDELVRALRAVVDGGSVIDPAVVEALLEHQARQERSPLAALTPRELEVLREMAQGKANRGIGGTLFLSESSVEKYVHTIFIKLGLIHEPLVHRRVLAVLTFLRESNDLGGSAR